MYLLLARNSGWMKHVTFTYYLHVILYGSGL